MKTTTYTNLALSITAVASLLTITSCGKKTEVTSSVTPSTESALTSIILDSEPADALSITEVRQSIEIGKKITMAGTVMGRMEPFVDGRALVVLGDPTIITACNLRPDDHCSTPWDVCCDDHDAIKASTATIQVVDADGRPFKQGLKGAGGIKELSDLVITGSIAKGSSKDNLLVSATGIFVKKK